jgi:hypothetical protein
MRVEWRLDLRPKRRVRRQRRVPALGIADRVPGGVVQRSHALPSAKVQRHGNLLAIASDDDELLALQLRVGRVPVDMHKRFELRRDSPMRVGHLQTSRGANVYGGLAVWQWFLRRRRLL